MFAHLPPRALSLILERLLPPSPLPVTLRTLSSFPDLFSLLLAYPALRSHLPHKPFHPLHTAHLLHPGSLTQGASSFDPPPSFPFFHAFPIIFSHHLLSVSLPPHLPKSTLHPLLHSLSSHCPRLSDLSLHDVSLPSTPLVTLFPKLVFLHVLQPSQRFLQTLVQPHDTLHTLSLHHVPPHHLSPHLHALLVSRFSSDEVTSSPAAAFSTISNLLLTVDLSETTDSSSTKPISKFFRLLSLLPSASPTSKFCSFSIAFHSSSSSSTTSSSIAQRFDKLFREQVFPPSQTNPLANLIESSAPPHTVHYLHHPGSVIDFQLPYLLPLHQLLQPLSTDPIISLQTSQASTLYFDGNSPIPLPRLSNTVDDGVVTANDGDDICDNLLDHVLDRCQNVPYLCIGWTPNNTPRLSTDMTSCFEFIDLICQLANSLPGLHTIEFEQDLLCSSIPLAAILDHPHAWHSISHILFSRSPHADVEYEVEDLLESVRQIAMLVRAFRFLDPRLQVVHLEARFFEGLVLKSVPDRSDVADAFNAVLELKEHLPCVYVHTLESQLQAILDEYPVAVLAAASSSSSVSVHPTSTHSPTSIK